MARPGAVGAVGAAGGARAAGAARAGAAGASGAAGATDAVDVAGAPGPSPAGADGGRPARAPFAGLPPVLIAAAECAPLAKSGGLADVVGALPKYLARLGVDARVILPYHRVVKERYARQARHLCHFYVDLGWRHQYVGLERLDLDGCTCYLVDNEFYFGGPIYCGGEFEGEQYAFFDRAVLEALPRLDFEPGILHCNDWHTAALPMLARTQYRGRPQGSLKTLLTIHNLAYQGKFSHEFLRDLLGVEDWLAGPDYLGHYGCDNLLKAGIVFADRVNTVSPTYAREITGPEMGEGLDGVLRSRGAALSGVLNGIDEDVWDPASDPGIARAYSAQDASGKPACRDALLAELGLEPAGGAPTLAMVGRLTPQKGVGLVLDVLDRLMGRDVRMVVLGSGDADLEDALRAAEGRHRGRLCSYIGFDGALSHRVYAGADLFLMPSAFEPCGISQMIAMRYGALPVVRETGGLRDTVVPYNRFTGAGTGFTFARYAADDLLGALDRALDAYADRAAFGGLRRQAMAEDFGFDRCARGYAELYARL